MKTSIQRKSEIRWADANIDDDIRELAEEISYQRHRILDLKVCVDTLRNLQYKVQSILNAYFTNTTLLVVNNAIKKTNIRNWVWTIIGERTVIVIVNNAGCTCCQGDHSVGIGRPVDVNGLL